MFFDDRYRQSREVIASEMAETRGAVLGRRWRFRF
jgi:hypothetical protein